MTSPKLGLTPRCWSSVFPAVSPDHTHGPAAFEAFIDAVLKLSAANFIGNEYCSTIQPQNNKIRQPYLTCGLRKIVTLEMLKQVVGHVMLHSRIYSW